MVDLIIIGSGPGGYVGAVRARQLGLKTVLIEKDERLGGTCLNVGCIPSKALLHSSWMVAIGAEKSTLSEMMQRKEKVVFDLTESVEHLMKKEGVECVRGEARLLSGHAVEVNGKRLEAKEILLATGSQAARLPHLPFDEKRILSSTGALALKEVPKRLVVVGGGAIGVELGSVYQRLGSQVTIVEMLDRIIPSMDRTLSKQLERILQKQGISIQTATRFDEKNFPEEKILVAIGRRPFTKGLGLEELGIQTLQSGQLVVDGEFRTSIPSIRAIGDLIDGPMLAHKASLEAVAAVELIAGLSPKVNYMAIPNIVYTQPEVASVGLTEEEAKALQVETLVGSVPMRGNPRARCTGELDGVVKVIGEKKSGKLIGLHLISDAASELISSGMIAISKGATLEEIGGAPWGHPTLGEAIKEAALVALKRPIH